MHVVIFIFIYIMHSSRSNFIFIILFYLKSVTRVSGARCKCFYFQLLFVISKELHVAFGLNVTM